MKTEVKNAIIISVTVILILVIVYLTTAVFMTGEIGGNKGNDEKKNTTTTSAKVTSIYDDMIIAGETLSRKEANYMVIFFSNDEATTRLKNAISNYDGETKLYKVNVDEAINSYVVSKDQTINVSSSKDLKVKVPTLLKISNGVVSNSINEESEILNELK